MRVMRGMRWIRSMDGMRSGRGWMRVGGNILLFEGGIGGEYCFFCTCACSAWVGVWR